MEGGWIQSHCTYNVQLRYEYEDGGFSAKVGCDPVPVRV